MSRTMSSVAPVRSRRARALVALTATAALALAGCSSDEAASPTDDGPDAQATADGMTMFGEWPLTGLPAEGKAPKHPAIAVKIDNTGSSSPQVGLGSADLVVEELVEGGSTRLAVFFYSKLPAGPVGPVRSMRATDIGIVEPADAVLVASGGAPPTVRRVAAADIKTFTEGATGYSRDSSRSAPYNLMMNLPALGRTLKAPEPPESYLPWGAPSDTTTGKPAKKIAAQFSGGHTTNWEFRGGKYVNLNSFAAENDRFEPDTVLVLRVQVGDAGYRDPAGNPVPETKFTGTGKAMLFHDGQMVKANWSKSGLGAALQLSTKAGDLTVPPGKVWIELVPTNGGNVTFSKK